MTPAPTTSSENLARFLREIASGDSQIRFTAWRNAARIGAPAISTLGDLAASPNKGVAKAAKGALEEITHYAARPGAPDEARDVSEQLLRLAESKQRPREVRAHVLYLLGFVAADTRAIAGITAILPDNEVGEDARMALERLNVALSRQ